MRANLFILLAFLVLCLTATGIPPAAAETDNGDDATAADTLEQQEQADEADAEGVEAEDEAAEAEPEPETLYVKPRGVPVYLQPDVAAIRLARLEEHQAVTALEDQFGWVRVRAGDVQGWIEEGDLTRQEPPRAEARPVAQAPQLRVERVMNPWWTAAAGLIGLLAGLIISYLWLDMRLRRRYGGMRMKL